MPAIVPLDRETQKGTLLVVGGPLFERRPAVREAQSGALLVAARYYTRWAWPEGQKPQVFVQDLCGMVDLWLSCFS